MDAIETVTAYLDAHNAHDIERTLAFLSDDFRFEAVGVWVRQGKHLARQLEEWDAAINSLLAPGNFAPIHGGVTCTMLERNNWFNLAGLDSVHYPSCDFGLQASKIASITATMATESARAVGQALQAITAWAGQHRPQTLDQLMPGGQLVYTRASAAIWLELLRDWHASK